MARKAKIARSVARRAPAVDGSWVLEGHEGDDTDDSYFPDPDPEEEEEEYSEQRVARQRARTGHAYQSPEPQLVMPYLNHDTTPSPDKNSHRNRRRLVHDKEDESLYARKARNENVTPARRKYPPREKRSTGEEPRAQTQTPMEDYWRHISRILIPCLAWALDVTGKAMHAIKTPISWILSLLLLVGLGIILRNIFVHTLYMSLVPICSIPGASLLGLPFCPGGMNTAKNAPPVEFENLIAVQSKFGDVLDETSETISLPTDMKRGEASIRDLRQLVRFSGLHSKNELGLEFDGFIETSRIASYDLQRFQSHIGRAVDSVLSTTRWTTRVLDDLSTRQISSGSAVFERMLAPFRGQDKKFTEQLLLDQYIAHTRIVEEEIAKLITEAQALLHVLANLEDRLDVIHGITTRDKTHAASNKEEVLSQLWTYFGGNRARIAKWERQLNLLRQVGAYRKSAYAAVSATVVRLQEMGAGLEDLRERVGAPEVLRYHNEIPLSVHLENIERGVERLELGRQAAREHEEKHLRTVLERGKGDERLLDG